MSNFALGISYDGSEFHGWQRQQSLPTIQGALEQALSQVANTPTTLSVAGRTDSGVHATGQVATFSSSANRSLVDWRRGLNALTPKSIHIHWVVPTSEHFHPRYHATARRYRYVFHDVGYEHPSMAGRVWSCAALDADAMHRAAQCLLGEHDFSSFRGAGCQSLTPMRRVNRCWVLRRGEFVVMDIEANAFVLHMVRNIAQGLYAIGCGQADLPLADLLAAKDRTQLGPTAPPQGLYLVAVSYPDVALPNCPDIPFLTGL